MARILFFLLFSLFIQQISLGQKIVDYYELLSEYDNDVKIHKISQKGAKWYTSNVDNKQVEITVDEKNNYIELSDNEKNGTFNLQLTLLKKSKNDLFITLVKNHMDQFLHGEIHILEYRNGRFIDITNKLIPEISIKDFTNDETYSKLKSNEKKEINTYLEIGYKIKNNGKKINAIVQKNIISEKCFNKEILNSDICNSMKSLNFTELTLIWDQKKEHFIIESRK